MSREAEAEALAIDYFGGALSPHDDSQVSPDMEPETMAMAMATGAAPRIDGKSTTQTVAAAGATAPKNNLSAFDLLHWSETPCPNQTRYRISATNDSSAFMNASDESPYVQLPFRSEVRTSQPAGGTSTISFGADLTSEEAEQLQKRRPSSDLKRREMIGSRIFEQEPVSKAAPADDINAKRALPAAPEAPTPTLIQYGSSANTEDSSLSPKRSTSLAEMAKQRELSGTFFGPGSDAPSSRRPNSSAKSKELEGSNIFGRSSRKDLLSTVTLKSLASDLNNYHEYTAPPRTGVKVSNPAGGRSQIIFGCDGGPEFGLQSKKQGHNQKAVELLGHGIFKDETSSVVNNNAANHMERVVSAAKRREIIGNDIFSTPTPINEDRPMRGRQPPGGESNLKLY